MDSLPLNLVEEILFRLDPKSLAMMRCTNRSIEKHISNDPNFKSEYSSRMGSSLLHISRYGSNLLCFHPFGDSRTFKSKDPLKNNWCHILGCCSGLLLLFVDGDFCVANPLTKNFRFLIRSEWQTTDCIGFAVDQIDRTTQKFKIVCTTGLTPFDSSKSRYRFNIYAGNSWRVSETTITYASSNLRTDPKPVYLHGDLYWLRDDGNMITFNPETEIARLIPIRFDKQANAKLLFAAGDNRLTLISATKEVIYVYALESILTDPKWILTRRIRNEPVQQSMLWYWNVEAFDGRCLVVTTMKNGINDGVIYGYDMRANKWGVVGSIPGWCDGIRNFYQFKPSWSSVFGLLDLNNGPKPTRVSSVEAIMGLINRTLRV